MRFQGKGNPKKVCICFQRDGIGDVIHSMPALYQKLKDGFEIQVRMKPFASPILERMGIEIVDGSNDEDNFGTVDRLCEEFGVVYSDYPIQLDIHGQTILRRFEWAAKEFETTLPEQFDFLPFIYPDAPKERRKDIILFAPRAEWRERSYPHIEDVFNHLSKYEPTECLGLFYQPKLDLKEFIEKIYHAKVVVSVETGILHFALALGTPCVAIVGGTDEWAYINQYSWYKDLKNVEIIRSQIRNEECVRPCNFSAIRGYGVNEKCKNGNSDCMQEVEPEKICETVFNLLKRL